MNTGVWTQSIVIGGCAREEPAAGPIVIPESNDLGWLSLSDTCEPRNGASELSRQSLVSDSDPQQESPDPFLSNDSWRQWTQSPRDSVRGPRS